MVRSSALLIASVLCFAGVPADAAPNDASVHYAAGLQFMKSGEFAKAGDSFWAAYQADSSTPLLWNAARAYHKGGKLVRARDLYQSFLEVEKQTEPRWKKALEFSKEVTQELEKQAELKAQKERQNREALEKEITDKVTQKILSRLGTKPEKTESVSKTIPATENNRSLEVEGWITLGVGAALGAGSLTLLLLGNGLQDQVQSPPSNGQGIVTVHTQKEAAALRKEADDLHTGALVVGLVGGAAVLAGLVMALASDNDSSVGVSPVAGGATLMWGAQF